MQRSDQDVAKFVQINEVQQQGFVVNQDRGLFDVDCAIISEQLRQRQRLPPQSLMSK